MSDSVILPAFCRKLKPLLGLCMVLLMAVACGFTGSAVESRSSASVPTAVEGEGNNEEAVSEGRLEGEFGGFMSFIEQKMASDCIPGVAAAVVRGDDLVFAQGFGMRDYENELPVTPETLFHIASTHKSLTAMMIASLVDEGLFAWDTPVVEIYPDFQLSDSSATQQVTIRHLLSMRGGIPDDAEDDFDADSTAADMFDVVAESDLLGQPGDVFEYSNLSYAISGYVGALASGGQLTTLYDDYATLLSERVLSPIGMESATIYYSQAQANPNHANSYTCQNNQPTLAESYDFDGDPLAPSGSLKANVVEMALYISTQLGRGVAPNGTRVVSEENLTATWQPYLEDYGMGWETSEHNGTQIIMHTGSYDNFESVMGFVPTLDIGFVVLSNAETGEALMSEAPFVLLDLLSQSEIWLPIVVAQ